MRPSRRDLRGGFTLPEMMVAVAVLLLLSVLLVYIATGIGAVWSRGESQNQYRQRARATLDYIGRELRLATLAPDRAASIARGIGTLQLLVDPASVTSSHLQRHALFWQAPIANDDKSQGDLAEVGYFVRWLDGQALLCRFFVNPTDTAHYTIYTARSGNWVSDSLLDALAPADKASRYRGLFLENVLGLWVEAQSSLASDAVSYKTPYDSSNPPDSLHPLPTSITISIAVIDDNSAIRLKKAYPSGSKPPAIISGLYSGSTNAEQFVDALNHSAIAPMLQGNAHAVSLRVRLDNYR